MSALPPGSAIGILGGGQLGRMLASAAVQLGYQTHILAPDAESVAAQTANSLTRAPYRDLDALDGLAAKCHVATYEFENIAVAPVEYLASKLPVHPSAKSLEIAQDRIREKEFVGELGLRTAPWAAINSLAELEQALAKIGTPAILKTVRDGYDGKGQARIYDATEAEAAWSAIGERPSILEGFVTFTHEFSIITVRGADGSHVSYPPPWNEHKDGILDRSSAPAPTEIAAHAEQASALAEKVAKALGHVGVLTLEFFATAEGPVFNEMAPRVHNSGHWTIEGAVTSQFENHIRAICGLPLGSTALTGAKVEMINLIGHDADRWADYLAEEDTHLHLYGKGEVRPGRKMGHLTRVKRG